MAPQSHRSKLQIWTSLLLENLWQSKDVVRLDNVMRLTRRLKESVERPPILKRFVTFFRSPVDDDSPPGCLDTSVEDAETLGTTLVFAAS